MPESSDVVLSRPTSSLNDIRRPVESELSEFKSYFRDAMKSRVFLLDQVVQVPIETEGEAVAAHSGSFDCQSMRRRH